VYLLTSHVFTLKEGRTDSRRQYYPPVHSADLLAFFFKPFIVFRDLLESDVIELISGDADIPQRNGAKRAHDHDDETFGRAR
jgi:hypothetical protein